MECEILEGDDSDEYEEYALPLKGNSIRYWYTSVTTVAQGLALFLVFGYAIPPIVISGANIDIYNGFTCGTAYDFVMILIFILFLIMLIMTFATKLPFPPIVAVICSGIYFSNFIGYWSIYRPEPDQIVSRITPYGNNHIE